jgi:hypothetical protein
MQRLAVTAELREFMRDVAAKVDWADTKELFGAEALVAECARGGRVEGTDVYRFTYYARDGHGRFMIDLREQQIRDIAAGHIDEIEALEHDPDTRVPRGQALLVWGEYDVDALAVRSERELGVALDGLQAMGSIDPLMIRLWATADEQVVAMLNGAECALFVVRGTVGYGTSIGDSARTGTFELTEHDLGEVSIAWSNCLSWRVVRPALLRFAERGELGEEVLLDGSIPSQLLMLGDFDREAMLASRRAPVSDPAQTSLPDKIPHGEWAGRLLRGLVELHLLELDTSILPAISARTAMLLLELGDDAQDEMPAAQKLAKELAKIRGIGALDATPGDLQIALRRTQYAPTMPVEVPWK